MWNGNRENAEKRPVGLAAGFLSGLGSGLGSRLALPLLVGSGIKKSQNLDNLINKTEWTKLKLVK